MRAAEAQHGQGAMARVQAAYIFSLYSLQNPSYGGCVVFYVHANQTNWTNVRKSVEDPKCVQVDVCGLHR